MTTKHNANVNLELKDIPMQVTSSEIWAQKYRLRDAGGNPIDADIDATYERTAKALASSEKARYRKKFEKQFLDAMYAGSIPAGRIMSNAGASDHKSAVSLINCTVSDSIPDSMDGILFKVHEAGLTLKAGCGIGYEFSTLRPNGAHVAGAGASTSGPLSFMDIYDKMCQTVSSAGGRRGAQMATFDISHPDVVEFIRAKRENGRLRQFNMSLLITNEFIAAVKAGANWQPTWQGEPYGPAYQAKELWDIIMSSTYDYAEPGFLVIDRINKYNNLWFCEHLRATNPCGEQPLPPYGACLLGSINLTHFVKHPFHKAAYFDLNAFHDTVRTFTRMLDNVVSISGLPLERQRQELLHKRRHGMGFLGLGSTFALLGMVYGSQASIELTTKISKTLAMAGFLEGAALSKEKGEAPVLKDCYYYEELLPHFKYNENIIPSKAKRNGWSGRELFLLSHYFDGWREDSDLNLVISDLEKYGSRFSHHSSIAPTGTISLSLANNASNGIEPSFSHFYTRNRIVEGRNTKEAVDVYSFEYLAYKTLVDPLCQPTLMPADERAEAEKISPDLSPEEISRKYHFLPPHFLATDDLTPKQHIDVQAAAQTYVDSAISKTVNVPTDISKEDFQDIYMYAVDKGLKGCTTYRFNPEAFQGVLVKAEDLKNTKYRFTLADGSSVEVAGDEMVEYEGQTSTAANLADAIKEGLYGKY